MRKIRRLRNPLNKLELYIFFEQRNYFPFLKSWTQHQQTETSKAFDSNFSTSLLGNRPDGILS